MIHNLETSDRDTIISKCCFPSTWYFNIPVTQNGALNQSSITWHFFFENMISETFDNFMGIMNTSFMLPMVEMLFNW